MINELEEELRANLGYLEGFEYVKIEARLLIDRLVLRFDEVGVQYLMEKVEQILQKGFDMVSIQNKHLLGDISLNSVSDSKMVKQKRRNLFLVLNHIIQKEIKPKVMAAVLPTSLELRKKYDKEDIIFMFLNTGSPYEFIEKLEERKMMDALKEQGIKSETDEEKRILESIKTYLGSFALPKVYPSSLKLLHKEILKVLDSSVDERRVENEFLRKEIERLKKQKKDNNAAKTNEKESIGPFFQDLFSREEKIITG
eukprot:snap_masked-scaffold_14-processed-gene-1.20-mRNA-1 protein AED:1.00 eAED:1.00 QI:0/-1/0/0/-1/1/1/0/254